VTYTVAALLGVAGALVVDLFVLRTRLVTRAVFWATYPIVFVFQLLSNGLLTGRRVVIYDPAAILGVRIAYAPVEDLLFGFAMILLTLSLWVWLGRRGVQREPRAGDGSALLARLRGSSRPEPPGVAEGRDD
jgi:lycopene cyclase domain-containing protein